VGSIIRVLLLLLLVQAGKRKREGASCFIACVYVYIGNKTEQSTFYLLINSTPQKKTDKSVSSL
jgi:hypothetical protein